VADTYFPLLIQYSDTKRKTVIRSVEQIPISTAFTVLQTNYTKEFICVECTCVDYFDYAHPKCPYCKGTGKSGTVGT